MKGITRTVCASLALALAGTAVHAQEPTRPEDMREIKTFPLAYATSSRDADEVLTGLRLELDPSVRVFLAPGSNTIAMRGTPRQFEQAQKLIRELDQPKKAYRIIFTIIDSDAGKQVGVQHFAMTAAAGQRATLKQGSKVPIATGSYDDGKTTTQFTYLDVGLSFDVTVDSLADGINLKSVVEQSSIGEVKTIASVNEPVIRQAKLEGTTIVPLGKPLTLGSLDVPGSTRHLDIEVVVEPQK